MQACRTQVALFRKPPDFGRRGAVYGDFVQGIYFKPTHGDMIHAGSLAGEEIHAPGESPIDYNEAADGDWLPASASASAGATRPCTAAYGRGGFGALYGITPDWHPILDKLPGMEGGYCAVGFSGHGFKMSPIVGQLMAELIVDGKANDPGHCAAAVRPLRGERPREDAVRLWRHGMTVGSAVLLPRRGRTTQARSAGTITPAWKNHTSPERGTMTPAWNHTARSASDGTFPLLRSGLV